MCKCFPSIRLHQADYFAANRNRTFYYVVFVFCIVQKRLIVKKKALKDSLETNEENWIGEQELGENGRRKNLNSHSALAVGSSEFAILFSFQLIFFTLEKL